MIVNYQLELQDLERQLNSIRLYRINYLTEYDNFDKQIRNYISILIDNFKEMEIFYLSQIYILKKILEVKHE